MPEQDYSPEQLRYWPSGRCPACRWAMLASAAEGGTQASGAGAGRGERQGLSHLKADMERAADSLPLHWQTTALVFRKQHRTDTLTARRRNHPHDAHAIHEEEHPAPTQALDNTLWRMALFLGYQQPLTDVA
jgi:hypothetical protein